MASKTIVLRDAKGLFRLLSTLSKEASDELRVTAKALAGEIGDKAADNARSVGGVAAFVAPSITGKRDRIPTVRMGSEKKLPTSGAGWTHSRAGSKQRVADVMWGAEFGSLTYRQFQPWTGNKSGAGYFLYPAVREMSDEIGERYAEALLKAIDQSAK